ncbi:MAG: enolase C-terminal domain-like protein [Burkholderiaceae bacterium]
MAQESQPRIKSIRVRAVKVPLQEPHRTASGMVAESPLILTDLETDDGTVGSSMVFTYTPAALKPTGDLISNIGAMLTDVPLAPRQMHQDLTARMRLLGSQGLVGIAIAAIDMAAWDALSKIHHLSLVQMLGGIAKPQTPYGAVGYDGIDGSAKEAERWAKQGLKGIKAKIGYPSVQEDLAVIQAMREAAGDDMAIMIDYNQSLTPTEAIERIRVLDDLGLVWIEEPTLAHDYAGHAQVAAAVKTPIQAGENWWGPGDMQLAISAKASNYLMPDVMKIGGVTGWMQAAALAQAGAYKVSNHLWPEISARLLCCTANAHWLEYTDWWNPILKDPLVVENGQALVDDRPGTGVMWDESAIGQYEA